ncbi:hypothetical protein [uncultured Alistipes sp.]|uniref:hypothetical protein n=1 Tax=uncultured Alistipes sp. TaxID=538949 RepID=UPI00320BA837
MNTQNQPVESLWYYPSEYITGRESNIPRSTAEFCLKEQTIEEFWRNAVKAIDQMSDSDKDGVVYTSDGIGVFLGPWDIDIRHNYKWTEERGGYTYMGIWEPYAELAESFEVVGAHDYDNDVELHRVVRLLNQYYKDNENILLNR